MPTLSDWIGTGSACASGVIAPAERESPLHLTLAQGSRAANAWTTPSRTPWSSASRASSRSPVSALWCAFRPGVTSVAPSTGPGSCRRPLSSRPHAGAPAPAGGDHGRVAVRCRARAQAAPHPHRGRVPAFRAHPRSYHQLVDQARGRLRRGEAIAAERAGYRALRLGPRVLRTETAAVAALSVGISLELGNLALEPYDNGANPCGDCVRSSGPCRRGSKSA